MDFGARAREPSPADPAGGRSDGHRRQRFGRGRAAGGGRVGGSVGRNYPGAGHSGMRTPAARGRERLQGRCRPRRRPCQRYVRRRCRSVQSRRATLGNAAWFVIGLAWRCLRQRPANAKRAGRRMPRGLPISNPSVRARRHDRRTHAQWRRPASGPGFLSALLPGTRWTAGKSRGDRMARAPEAIVWSRTMKPASFSYASCDTVQEAMQLLAEHGDDARVIAGGQSLMPMLNMRLVRPAVVVDIAAIAALNYAKEESGFVEFGAALTQSGAETWPRLRETVPLLALAFPHIGHIQTRNRGTVC